MNILTEFSSVLEPVCFFYFTSGEYLAISAPTTNNTWLSYKVVACHLCVEKLTSTVYYSLFSGKVLVIKLCYIWKCGFQDKVHFIFIKGAAVRDTNGHYKCTVKRFESICTIKVFRCGQSMNIFVPKHPNAEIFEFQL